MAYYNEYNNRKKTDEVDRAIKGINDWIKYSKEKGMGDNYIRKHLLNLSFDEFARVTQRDKIQIKINHVSLYAYRI